MIDHSHLKTSLEMNTNSHGKTIKYSIYSWPGNHVYHELRLNV